MERLVPIALGGATGTARRYLASMVAAFLTTGMMGGLTTYSADLPSSSRSSTTRDAWRRCFPRWIA